MRINRGLSPFCFLDGVRKLWNQHRHQGSDSGARVLALTRIDILTDPGFRNAMQTDFYKRTEGFVYKSPILDMIREPVGLPDEIRQHGSILDLKK